MAFEVHVSLKVAQINVSIIDVKPCDAVYVSMFVLHLCENKTNIYFPLSLPSNFALFFSYP